MILTRGVYSLSNYSIRYEQYEAIENENTYITTKMIYPIEREAVAYFDKEKEFKVEHFSPNFHPTLEVYVTDKTLDDPESFIRNYFQQWFRSKVFEINDMKYILPTVKENIEEEIEIDKE